jgi:hypothetical protein
MLLFLTIFFPTYALVDVYVDIFFMLEEEGKWK